jgi:hypothetical protein
MFQRRLPVSSFTATTQFFGSVAGGVQLVPTNTSRANLQIQPLADAARISPIGSLTGSSMLIASQQIYSPPDGYVGAVFIAPNAGATGPIAWWESSF